MGCCKEILIGSRYVSRTMPACDAPNWTSAPLTPELVQRLTPQWAAMAATAAERTIFHFPWFIAASMPLLARYAPQLVTIGQGDRLIGLLVVRGDRGFAKMPIPFLRTALHYEQYLGTPLVRGGSEAAFAAGLLGWLDAAPRHYCLLHLGLMALDGPVARAIADLCRAERRGLMTLNRVERAAIALPRAPGTGAEDHLPASRRKSLRRYAASLATLGTVTREQLTERGALDTWMDDFLAMEHSGWKAEGGSSILSCPHETALYRAVAAAALAQDMLHFSRLCLDGRPIAYTLDVGSGPDIYCLKSAFDQQLKKYSPGVLAEVATLRHYWAQPGPCRIDSCTSPDNALLNELWPDRKAMGALSIARRGAGYGGLFALARWAKRVKYGGDGI